MEIKPIRPVDKVTPAEIPETRVDRNLPRDPSSLKLPSGIWKFAKGLIVINGKNIGVLLEEAVEQPAAFWSQVANDLHAFLQHNLKRTARQRKKKIGEMDEDYVLDNELAQLSALVEAYIAKIMRIIKRKYDEKADGFSYTLDEDGQLILNGINITSFIQTASQHPSEKAILFLKGLKNRLGVILSNKMGNSNYEKIREATYKLYDEIDRELKRIVEKDRLIENR